MSTSSSSTDFFTAAPPPPISAPPPSPAPTRRNLWPAMAGVIALILQRLILGALVLLAIIYLTLLGLELASGAPLLASLQTAFVNSVLYGQRLIHGDLGMGVATTSINNPVPVSSFLWKVFARSLVLLGLALAIATMAGVAMGVRAATRDHADPGANRSLAILLVSIIGVSIPSFFAALLLQMMVIRWTRLTGHALLPVGGFGWDRHMILPAIVLAARPIAQITRITFVSVSQTLRQDYVRTAASKGLSSRRVLWGHVIRNAAVPILTTLGVSMRFSLSSLPVVELFFGWPGAGFTMLKAISVGDANTTLALLLAFGSLFIAVNLVLEILYGLVDPRLRDLARRAAIENRHTVSAAVGELGHALVSLFSFVWLAGLGQSLAGIFSRERWRADAFSGRSNWRTWRRGLAGNVPLLLGAIMVVGLLIVFLLGPRLAPHSPYATQGLAIVDGEFLVPPFPPGAVHPWGADVLGRDMMSLVLAGAQQTLSLAALAVLARMLIGFVLGALAGWFNDSWLDRAIQAAAQVTAAFPTLLLAMLLILAFGIRGGFRPFLMGLSLVGWSEIMQFVRGEVMSIRPRLFIESAISTGARTARLIWHHVLPNLLPALISLAALEMGAVLMLLGELGFIGIFMGGGAFAELQIDSPPYHYSDAPEWGALLSNVRMYARAYPWTALYPATAFFMAILGFNLLGEGLRRLVESVGAQFTRLWNRYTFLALILLILGAGWVQANTGATAFYRRQARTFDASAALATTQSLAQEAWSGRALGSDGQGEAAHYIADRFADLGLQRPAGDNAYFVPHAREYEQITATPQLLLHDGGPPLAYRTDYAEFVGPFRNLGEVDGPVHFLATGFLDNRTGGSTSLLPRPLRKLDFSDGALLLLSTEDAVTFSRLPYGGLLVVTDDPLLLARRFTMPARTPVMRTFGGRETGQDAPILWISQAVADRILAPSGHTVAELRRTVGELAPEEVLTFATGASARLHVEGELHDGVASPHVVGHLPAAEGQGLGDKLIVVTAQYDAPPIGPDGVYPAANDNASGVALMLEVIRTLRESGYQPYKTFLFVAYSGEGSEGGVPAWPLDLDGLLADLPGFRDNFELEAVVDLRGVGAGEGRRLSIEASGSLRLANLLETAAARAGSPATRAGEPVDLSIVFDRSQTRSGGQDAPTVGVGWSGWEQTARTAADTPDIIDESKVRRTGETVALALMALGRETDY